MRYRIYADGSVIDENDFNEKDNSLPYYDDYGEYYVPDEIVEYIYESL